jgi:hypothetical protein
MDDYVDENPFIGLEDLSVQGMLAREAHCAQPHLAQSIGDAGGSAFVTLLGYKGAWYALPGSKDQPLVSVFEDLLRLWHAEGSDAVAGTPVAVSDLWHSP